SSDPRYGAQRCLVSGSDGVQAVEVRRQFASGLRADIGNAQSMQQPPQGWSPCGGDGAKQIVGRQIGKSIQLQQVLLPEREQISNRSDQAARDEGVDGF